MTGTSIVNGNIDSEGILLRIQSSPRAPISKVANDSTCAIIPVAVDMV